MSVVRRLACVVVGIGCACSGPTDPSPGPPRSGIPDFVDCARFPESGSAPYVLPFAVDQSFRVTNTFGHYTLGNEGVGLYAIDFLMPMATPVHASRSGVVVAVQERFSDEDHADLHENWVMIRHSDDTVGRYIHLAQNGALVEVGDTVAQGQMIGLSGNSGASSEPHLTSTSRPAARTSLPATTIRPAG